MTSKSDIPKVNPSLPRRRFLIRLLGLALPGIGFFAFSAAKTKVDVYRVPDYQALYQNEVINWQANKTLGLKCVVVD